MSAEIDNLWRQIEMLRAADAEHSAHVAVLEERVANTIATWDERSSKRDVVLQTILTEVKQLNSQQDQRTGMEKLGRALVAVVGIVLTIIGLLFAYKEISGDAS